ncbi:hypothetical protein CI102_6235 [Trichoderma harzianum]|nr:hypothetical protein CI102_6235 [Trichoderma harzianum]
MTRDRLIQSSREIRFATRFVPCDRCTRGSVADGLELSIAANQDQPFPNPDPCVADVALKLRRQRGMLLKDGGTLKCHQAIWPVHNLGDTAALATWHMGDQPVLLLLVIATRATATHCCSTCLNRKVGCSVQLQDGQDEDAEPGLGMRGRCRQQPGPISIPAIGYLSLSQANQDCRPVARTFNATDSGSK